MFLNELLQNVFMFSVGTVAFFTGVLIGFVLFVFTDTGRAEWEPSEYD